MRRAEQADCVRRSLNSKKAIRLQINGQSLGRKQIRKGLQCTISFAPKKELPPRCSGPSTRLRLCLRQSCCERQYSADFLSYLHSWLRDRGHRPRSRLCYLGTDAIRDVVRSQRRRCALCEALRILSRRQTRRSAELANSKGRRKASCSSARRFRSYMAPLGRPAFQNHQIWCWRSRTGLRI